MQDLSQEASDHRVPDRIVRRMAELIGDGRLAPGSRLPPERELMARLAVGRSSLREALSILEALGYVEVRSRRGIFVKGPAPSLSLEPLSRLLQEDFARLRMLYEVRNDIELAAAAAAARVRTPADLEEMSRCLERLEAAQAQDAFRWEHDRDFHTAVARASHNVIRVHMVAHLFSFARPLLEPWASQLLAEPECCSRLNAQHRAVFAAIAAADPDDARLRMQEHFAWTDAKIDECRRPLPDRTAGA